MIQAIKIAGASLIAHRRKTWAIIASITLGITALFLVGGYYEYSFWGLKQSLIRSQYAHLQIYPVGYRADRDIMPFAHSLADSEKLMSALKGDPAVKVVAPRSRAMGMVNGNPVEIWGVDPDRESGIFTFTTSRRGRSLKADDGSSCQMSPLLAKKIGASLNDTVTLTGVRADMQFNAVEVGIQSLVGGYAEEFNLMTVIVPQRVFLDLFGTAGTHEIAVLFRDDSNLSRRRDQLQESLRSGGWETDIAIWYEQATYFRQVVEYYQGFYRIVLAIVAIIVFFATGTTMSLSLLERTREFGTCLSMGARRSGLVIGILTEALLAGFVGLLAGIAVSAIAALTVNALGGISMPAAPGMATALHVLIRFSPQAAGLSLVTALLVPLAAVILPARRIMKLSIVRLLNKGAA